MQFLRTWNYNHERQCKCAYGHGLKMEIIGMTRAMHAASVDERLSKNMGERDGLRDNIILLNTLSEKLDVYFAMHTLKEFSEW